MSLISQVQEYRATIVLLIAGTIAGFFVGRLSIPPPTPTSAPREAPSPPPVPAKEPVKEKPLPKNEYPDWSDDDEAQGELSEFPGVNEECKLVLVVRTDLGMTKGKIAAQASHATLACYKALSKHEASASSSHKSKSRRANKHSLLQRWENMGQAKIAVQVKSEEELLILQAQAMSLGLCARIIHDAGRTQIASGSATVLGIGPGPRSVIDKVTGGLKLL